MSERERLIAALHAHLEGETLSLTDAEDVIDLLADDGREIERLRGFLCSLAGGDTDDDLGADVRSLTPDDWAGIIAAGNELAESMLSAVSDDLARTADEVDRLTAENARLREINDRQTSVFFDVETVLVREGRWEPGIDGPSIWERIESDGRRIRDLEAAQKVVER